MDHMSKRRCWICNAPANSAEHRFKKSDLIRSYGRGPYEGDDELLHFREGGAEPVIIKGPNAFSLKYSASLCHKCNTTLTQPFDRSYDILMRWIISNQNQVIQKRFINFAEVYGEQFEGLQRNLFKYFAKSFGCRLVEAGYPVPEDVIGLLDLTYFQTGLCLTFAINEDVLLLSSNIRDGFIGKGDLTIILNRYDDSDIRGYFRSERVSWFTVFYWYKRLPDGNLGSTWVANSQYVYLGSYQPLSAEIRDQIITKEDT
jgi:hypothetical protein